MDIYSRIQSIVLVILIIASRHQAETSKWSVELIFPCTTIAKSNLTMNVPRYNSANDRAMFPRFKSYGHRFDRKDRIEWKVFGRGVRLFVAILLPYLKFNFLGPKAVAGEVCHQWRRAIARERMEDGTVEKACPRRFHLILKYTVNPSILE